MADPVQMKAKEKRLAEALRANLRRRKEQTREREETAQEDAAAVHVDGKPKPDQKTE